MLLCYITDRRQFPGSDAEQQRKLLDKVAEAATANIDYIQLREKDLSPAALEKLAREAVARVKAAREQGSRSRLLINSRTDVALASGADGVHLTAADVPAGDVRALWMATRDTPPVIGVSCHTVAEVRMAESQGADFAVLAPIFGKQKSGAPAIGIAVLKEAQRGSFPVLALGGVNLENARQCVEAGAAGVAGIRLFQENVSEEVVEKLRGPW